VSAYPLRQRVADLVKAAVVHDDEQIAFVFEQGDVLRRIAANDRRARGKRVSSCRRPRRHEETPPLAVAHSK
jgi:hypothetical protein